MPDKSYDEIIIKAVEIDQDVYEEAMKKAKSLGMSWSQYVVLVLQKYLEKH